MAEAKKSATKKTAAKKSPAKKAAEPVATAKKAAAKKAVAAKSTATKKPVAAKRDPSYQQIAELAHLYWLERGGHHGSDKEDWVRAERELRTA